MDLYLCGFNQATYQVRQDWKKKSLRLGSVGESVIYLPDSVRNTLEETYFN